MTPLRGRVVVKPGVLCKPLGDEAVLLDLPSETYFGLNETGARLWMLLAADPSVERAIETLLEEFEIGRETLERDTGALVETLLAQGLVSVEGA